MNQAFTYDPALEAYVRMHALAFDEGAQWRIGRQECAAVDLWHVSVPWLAAADEIGLMREDHYRDGWLTLPELPNAPMLHLVDSKQDALGATSEHQRWAQNEMTMLVAGEVSESAEGEGPVIWIALAAFYNPSLPNCGPYTGI